MNRFPGFSPEALTFLRNLKRNNRREWFQPRKEKYESLIKVPMLELVSCLNEEFARFAPDHVTPPQKAVFRIYRDVRFSHNKAPYKTHVAGIFPLQTLSRKEGGAFYFHFTPKELLVFGGVWTPERDELLAIRSLIQENHEELQQILSDRTLRRAVGRLQGEQLSRMPKGFPPDHPAEAILRQKHWYLETTVDAKLVTTPRLLPELARYFRLMAPLVEFLNRPFAEKKRAKAALSLW
jgi:uncharacterized protein (TIGR02453 family)